MSEPHSPTIRRRRLAFELRRLRAKSGYTAEQVCAQLGWSKGRLNRWEANQWTRPDLSALRDLLRFYDVSSQEHDQILELAKMSRQKGWWAEYSDIFGDGVFVELEAEASVIRSYHPVVLPGLLQTAEYAEALMIGARIHDTKEIERRVAARLARQDRLRGEHAPRLWAVIDEAVLQRMVGGPAVMAEQIDALCRANEQTNINIQLIPNSFGAHAALGAQFVLLDFPHPLDAPVVYLDTPTGELLLEKQEEIADYNLLFQHVTGAAAAPSESSALMRGLVQRQR